MKKAYQVTINIMAYSQSDAEAKVEMLMQIGAFPKDLNVENLAGAALKCFITSTVYRVTTELLEKKQKEQERPNLSHNSIGIIPPIQ